MLYFVDRSIAVIKPKALFLAWLQGLPTQNMMDITLDNLRVDCTTLLIPETEDPEDAIAYIDQVFEAIFEAELASWEQDATLWPADRSLLAFWTWFDVELHTTVLDSVDDELSNIPLN
jgi:hypothetical protein